MESAASGPDDGATASPVSALLMLRTDGPFDHPPAWPLAAGDPHVLRVDLFQHQKLKIVVAREVGDLFGRDAHAAPGVVLLRVRGQAVQLAAQNAARLEHAARLAQIMEHHVLAGDVLEDGVGVDEVELLVGKEGQIAAGAVMRERVGRVLQALSGQADHLVGHIHAVDFAEVAAERAHAGVRGHSRFRARRRGRGVA